MEGTPGEKAMPLMGQYPPDPTITSWSNHRPRGPKAANANGGYPRRESSAIDEVFESHCCQYIGGNVLDERVKGLKDK